MDPALFIEWCLEHLNYLNVFILMVIESSFIPFPSEVVVAPAAYIAAEGELNVVLVVVVATLGANIGACVNYYLAMYVGRPVIYRFANSRLGALCLLDEAKVKHAEEYFARHGAVSTFVGRLIPAVRQLISIPAGLARMPLGTFLLYTTLGAGIWNTVLAAFGYYFQSFMSKDEMQAKLTEYNTEFKYICFAIIAIVILYLAIRTIRRKKN